MADFRLMHKLVTYIDKENTNISEDKSMTGHLKRTVADGLLMNMQVPSAISWLTENSKATPTKAQRVFKTAAEYGFISIHKHPSGGSQPDRVSVTHKKGQSFIYKLWIYPAGLIQAWADENKSANTLVLTFVTGVIFGVAAIVIAIIGL